MKTGILISLFLLLVPTVTFSNECKTDSVETFINSFFEHKDTQINFIKFPFKMSHLIDGEHEPMQEVNTLTPSAFQQIQGVINFQYLNAHNRGAVKEVEITADSSIILKYSGSDSGYLIKYYFIKTENCWKLYAFENAST